MANSFQSKDASQSGGSELLTECSDGASRPQTIAAAEGTGLDDGFSPRVVELAEQFQTLAASEQPVDLDAFVARTPDVAEPLRRAIRLFATLQSAGGETLEEQEFQRTLSDATQLANLVTDSELDHFVIRHTIGRGGMGIVYRAFDQVLRRDVAIKVLNPDLLESAQIAKDVLRQFEEEARASAQLQHSGILVVHGIYPWRTVYYIVMPYVEGRTWKQLAGDWQRSVVRSAGLPADSTPDAMTVRQILSDAAEESAARSAEGFDLQNEPPPDWPTRVSQPTLSVSGSDESDVRPVVRGSAGLARWSARPDRCQDLEFWQDLVRAGLHLARALEHAHQHSILHRDVKPANVMMDARGDVQLMDFGLAVFRATAHTGTGAIAGSRRYMSRDQLRGRVSERSDVYGLGVTLLELVLAGFGQPADASVIAVDEHGCHRRRAVRDCCPDCPPDLSAVIDKALFASAGGYATAHELAADLQRVLDGHETTARRWSLARRGQRFAVEHRRATGIIVFMILLLLICAPLMIATRAALISSRRARENSDRLRLELQEKNAVQAVRASQRLLELGLRYDGMQELGGVSPDLSSWDTQWLTKIGEPQLSGRTGVATGDWGTLDAAVSDDGRLLAVASASGQLAVWDLVSHAPAVTLLHGRLTARGDGASRFLHHFEDRETGTTPVDWPEDCPVSVAWHDLYSLRVLTLGGGVIEFQNVLAEPMSATLRPTHHELKPRAETLNSGRWSPDGTTAVLGFESGRVQLVDCTNDSVATHDWIPADAGDVLTDAVCCPEAGLWLLGYRSGRVRAVTTDGAECWRVQLSGPIWSLAARSVNDFLQVAVACESSDLVLLETPAARTLPGLRRIGVPGLPIRPRSVPFVAFHPVHGEQLVAVDSLSRIMRVDLSSSRVTSVERTLPEDRRYRQQRSQQRFVRPLNDLPIVFQRLASCLVEVSLPVENAEWRAGQQPTGHLTNDGSDRETLLGIGSWDSTFAIWRDQTLPSSEDAGSDAARSLLKTNAGPEACLAPSTQFPDQFWIMNRSLGLRLVSATDDALTASLELTDRRPIDMLVRSRESRDAAIVLFADGSLREYRFQDGQIAESEIGTISTDADVLRLGASADGSTLAVSDSLGHLHIATRTEDGLVTQSLHPVQTEQMMSTGAVAVSPDGRWVAGGSTGQTLLTAVLDETTGHYHSFRHEMDIGGDGVETLALTQASDGDGCVCAVTDSLRRVRVGMLRRQENQIPRAMANTEFNEARTRQSIATPDGRRIVLVQPGGQLVFLSSSTGDLMCSVRTTLEDCWSAAFLNDGYHLVIASHRGDMECLNARPRNPRNVVQDWLSSLKTPFRTAWRTTEVRIPMQPATLLPHHLALHAVSSADWTVAVAVGAAERRAPYLGQLLVATSDVPAMERFPVENELVDLRGFAAWQDPMSHRRLVACRVVPFDEVRSNVYSGDLVVGIENSPGNWAFERPASGGNFGFNPLLTMARDGQPVCFHHSYGHNETLVHRRNKDGSWTSAAPGHRGFHAVGLRQDPSTGDWLLTGSCGRQFFAQAPSPLLRVNDDLQWQYVPWPTDWTPHRMKSQARTAVVISAPGLTVASGSSLQVLGDSPSAIQSVRLPVEMPSIRDASVTSDGAIDCLFIIDDQLRLVRMRDGDCQEIPLPDLPPAVEPGFGAKLIHSAVDRVSLLIAVVNRDEAGLGTGLLVQHVETSL